MKVMAFQVLFITLLVPVVLPLLADAAASGEEQEQGSSRPHLSFVFKHDGVCRGPQWQRALEEEAARVAVEDVGNCSSIASPVRFTLAAASVSCVYSFSLHLL